MKHFRRAHRVAPRSCISISSAPGEASRRGDTSAGPWRAQRGATCVTSCRHVAVHWQSRGAAASFNVTATDVAHTSPLRDHCSCASSRSPQCDPPPTQVINTNVSTKSFPLSPSPLGATPATAARRTWLLPRHPPHSSPTKPLTLRPLPCPRGAQPPPLPTRPEREPDTCHCIHFFLAPRGRRHGGHHLVCLSRSNAGCNHGASRWRQGRNCRDPYRPSLPRLGGHPSHPFGPSIASAAAYR